MLDPLTAISLASSIVQLTDFGIKVVSGSLRLYYSENGLDMEKSNLEGSTSRLRTYNDKVLASVERSGEASSVSGDQKDLIILAQRCREVATDLLLELDSLKVKRPAGLRRKFESAKRAIAAEVPWNKAKRASLESELSKMRLEIFGKIQLIMR